MSFEAEAEAGLLPSQYPGRDGLPVHIATMEDRHLYCSWKWQFEHNHGSPLYKALQREKERRSSLKREKKERERAYNASQGHSEKVRETLERLRKKVMRERARCNKIQKATTDPLSKERAFGEASICSMIVSFIDVELRNL